MPLTVDPKAIELIKRVTGATAVRPYPSGEGEGYARTLDAQSIVFIDEAGAVRRVSVADLNAALAAEAQAPAAPAVPEPPPEL